jgi:4'-phosphopantetheinyl transferase EntD
MKQPNISFLDSLFPSEVIINEVNPAQIQGSIYPEEETFIQKAVPKRKQEFIAGRLCVRKALAKIGITLFPVLMGNDRAPVWPPGVVGSISHSEGYCGVAIAQKPNIESIGLDVEYVGQVKRDIWKHFCNQQELSWINSLPINDQQKIAALIFSAKECLYKCQYPISKRWLNFHDVTISANSNKNEFEARFLVDAGKCFKKGTCLKGKYLISNGYVFTGMTLRKNLY